LNVLLEL